MPEEFQPPGESPYQIGTRVAKKLRGVIVEILKAALKPSNPKVTGGQDDSLTGQDYSLHPGRLQAGWQGSIHKIQTSLANNKYLQQLRQRIPRM